MAARPVWKGHLRLSLVSIPVEMYSATNSSARVSFRQVHKPSGKRVHYQKVVPGVGPVKNEDIWKGFETDKDEYVLISPEDIDAVKLESKKTLELVQFVDACEIPPLYFDKPYLLAPQDELAEDAFRVVRDALEQTRKVGLGQLSLRGREYLAAIKPCGTGLLLETLHYEEEIRKTDAFFSGISRSPADKDLLGVAEELIERKTAPFDATAFKDRYHEALQQLIDKKTKGRKRTRTATAGDDAGPGRNDNVVDLMASLKKSLEQTKPGTRKKTAAAGSRRKKSA